MNSPGAHLWNLAMQYELDQIQKYNIWCKEAVRNRYVRLSVTATTEEQDIYIDASIGDDKILSSGEGLKLQYVT